MSRHHDRSCRRKRPLPRRPSSAARHNWVSKQVDEINPLTSYENVVSAVIVGIGYEAHRHHSRVLSLLQDPRQARSRADSHPRLPPPTTAGLGDKETGGRPRCQCGGRSSRPSTTTAPNSPCPSRRGSCPTRGCGGRSRGDRPFSASARHRGRPAPACRCTTPSHRCRPRRRRRRPARRRARRQDTPRRRPPRSQACRQRATVRLVRRLQGRPCRA